MYSPHFQYTKACKPPLHCAKITLSLFFFLYLHVKSIRIYPVPKACTFTLFALPYSGNFLNGAKFCIFCMKPEDMKIKSTNI